MALSSRRKGGGFREINVTPLVDVMLVLLMVFLVTAPLLTASVEVKLPKVAGVPAAVRDPKLVLAVTSQGRVMLDTRDVSDDVYGALLADARVQRERTVYVRADRDARYADVARALASAKQAGVTALDLLVEPQGAAGASAR
ncbi:MAG: ExbD/TolR family protein [Polyangiales bacterium]